MSPFDWALAVDRTALTRIDITQNLPVYIMGIHQDPPVTSGIHLGKNDALLINIRSSMFGVCVYVFLCCVLYYYVLLKTACNTVCSQIT